MKMFCVYDVKAKAYNTPWFAKTRGLALRSWEELVNDKNTQVGKYPADFTLFELGEYDEQHGSMKMYEIKQSCGTALDFVKEKTDGPFQIAK